MPTIDRTLGTVSRPAEMLEAAAKLAEFHGPALVVWGGQDRMMPPEHGRRLAELIPGAELLELAP